MKNSGSEGTREMAGMRKHAEPISALRPGLVLAVAFLLSTFSARAGAVLTTLHSFEWFTNGATPEGLVRGNDGNYYGTTAGGGTNDSGTIFRITTNGALTGLYSFTGGNDGGNPYGRMVPGSDGNFYGAAYTGGTNQRYGTIFKFATNSATLTSLYSFSGSNDGANPFGGLIQTSDGVLYGTASGGSTNGWGSVFKVTTAGVLTNLYAFTGGNDGAVPDGPLVRGNDGSLYGTTRYGGTTSNGTVFKITTNGAFTSLHSFDFANGANPQGGLIQATDGNFYGTAFSGGGDNDGIIYKISSSGTFSNLYSFTGGADGGNPAATLAVGTDGNFYGTSSAGGTSGQGGVFKVTAGGALTNFYSFTGGNDGAVPEAPLVLGVDGLFYSTTTKHGSSNANSAGTVFKIATNGNLTGLYAFTCGNEGEVPYAGVVQGRDGYLYGTVYDGGSNGLGAVFKINTNGTLTSLHSFNGSDGENPEAPLLQGSDGNLYGTTYSGGSNNQGTVFKISTNGALSSLYSFSGSSDGSNPQAGLVQVGTNFYGTTSGGGSSFQGAVFSISTNGVFANLYSFTGNDDGGNPAAGLVRGMDGNLYGTTYQGGTNGIGAVFKIATDGTFTNLYSFSGPDGAFPQAGVVQASDGNFYGVTLYGGSNNVGNIFRITSSGVLTDLYDFSGGVDGDNPYGTLVQASDGYLYGTTYFGGSFDNGCVFRISTAGVFTSMYSFVGAVGGADGANPEGGVIQGADGAFYGTTVNGGQGGDIGVGDGTVFRLAIGEAVPAFRPVTLNGTTVNLTWSTSPGGVYQLQYKTNANSGTWSNLGSSIIAAGTTISTNDTATNGVRRFYRAVLMP
jgi:uncharacterized repeat protein (TIGR03803 family)